MKKFDLVVNPAGSGEPVVAAGAASWARVALVEKHRRVRDRRS